MKTIIVATDFSASADNALSYGANLARQIGASVILFNSFYMPVPTTYANYPSNPPIAKDVQELIAEHKVRLRNLAIETSTKYGIIVDAVTGTSSLQEELDGLVEQHNAVLVIMGMSSSAALRNIFGSNTIAVMQKAKYPVLIVPSSAKYEGIHRILFACDYNELTATNRLSFLKELALAYHARIEIFYVLPSSEPIDVDEIDEKFRSVNFEKTFRGVSHSYKEVYDDDVIDSIEKNIKDYNADLLVMIPHSTDMWDVVLGYSTTRKMAVHTHVPLLTLPNPSLK